MTVKKTDKRLLCPKCKHLGVLRGRVRGYTYMRCSRLRCLHEWSVKGYEAVPLPTLAVHSTKRQAVARRRVRAAKRGAR